MSVNGEVSVEDVYPGPAWGTPPKLTEAEIDAYLVRLALKPAKIRARKPDLDLLTDLQLNHCIRVPYESAAIHFKDDEAAQDVTPDTPFKLQEGPGVPTELPDIYKRVMVDGRGGFCFLQNTAYSALLRGLGYKVSESCARVYMNRNLDPKKHGYVWTPIVHMVLVVTFEDKTRYLTDVGWGWGSFDRPCKLEHGAVSHSLVSAESVVLRQEPLPGADVDALPDNGNGWTLWREYTDKDSGEKHWSPCYAFILSSFTHYDFTCFSYFSSFHPTAVFPAVLLVTRLTKNGSRLTLQYDRKMEAEGKKARYFVREGEMGKIIEEQEVDLTYGAMSAILRRKFGFKRLHGLRPEDDVEITFD